MALTTNLITNPSFVSGTTGWNPTASTTLTPLTSGGLYGNKCMQVTKPNSINSGIYSSASAAITAGLTYTASAYIKIPSGQESGNFKVGIGFYNSGNTLIGSINYSGLTTISSANSWIRVYNSYVAPANSSYARVYVLQDNAGTSGQLFLVDAVQLENSYDPMPFVETLNQSQETAAVNDGLRPVPVPHLTGMELNADIMLNDLLLNTVDYNKCVWVCTGLKGWWDVPDPEIPDLTRGLDDGSYDVRGRWAARNITLTGSILVPNRDAAPAARDRLVNAINLVYSGGWLLVGENPTKAAYVRLSGRPEIKNVNPRGRIDFSIGLRAANPLKLKWNWNGNNGYESSTVSAGSSATVTNSGNAIVPTILTLTGPLTQPITIGNSTSGTSLKVVKDLRAAGYSKAITKAARSGTTVTLTVASGHGFVVGDIINIDGVTDVGYTGLNSDNSNTVTSVTSTTIVYTSSSSGTLAELTLTAGATINLVSADTLKIDTYNRSVLFNNSPTIARSYVDTKVDWISLQPGNNTITFTPTSGSTTLDIKYRSGWIG